LYERLLWHLLPVYWCATAQKFLYLQAILKHTNRPGRLFIISPTIDVSLRPLVELASAILRDCRSLAALGWDPDLLMLTVDSLERLADDAAKHDLDHVRDQALDLYAYLSGMQEEHTPSLSHCELFNRLTERLADSLSAYLPQGEEKIRYIAVLSDETNLPPALIKAFEGRGFVVRSFADSARLAEILAQTPASALLVDSSQVEAMCEMIDVLSKQVPANGSTVVVAIGHGNSAARLQSMLQGAELYFDRLDDLNLVARVIEVIERSSEDPYRVLVVDDDAGTRMYLRLVLEQAGMSVLECGDPLAVMDHISNFQPDLLLLDLHMKGLDGLSLTMELRQQPELSVLPIVFISVEHKEETRFRAIQAGGDDFLTKPVRPRVLIAEVRSRIKRARLVKHQLPVSSGLLLRGGQLRRGDFLKQLAAVLSRPTAAWQVLLSMKIDQADELGKQLGLAGAYELEQAVAKHFSEALRDTDAYTTWLEFGFGILLQRNSREEIIELAQLLCKKIASVTFDVQGKQSKLTLSIGVALVPAGADGGDADRWFASAYAAHSIAHRLGGNRYDGVLTREHGAMPAERVMIIREWVKEAANGNNIAIEFQPMLPLHGDGVGLYALDAKLRDYRAPLAGVTRKEYMNLARDAHALFMIDRLSLFRAFEAIEEERARGRNTRILVPMDLASINEAQLHWLQAELRRRKAYTDGLLIELDATLLLEHPELEYTLHQLKNLDVSLVLSDDSGSLTRVESLQQFPVTMLRLPYGTIENIPSQTFIELLRPWYDSGRSLIVDRVENTDAVAQLWALEVAYLQGDALAASGTRLDYEFVEYGV
jgi:DNA-binding response OmpR family regulator/EAL domain-containing protein (putative c-di-GMP-specific phosphodiesterase class I)/GGDEF domain-containing protein